MERTPHKLLLVAMLAIAAFLSMPAYACGALWVHVEGGEARLTGDFRQYLPATAEVRCGDAADIVIAEKTNKLVRRSGSITGEFDGRVLTVQIGLQSFDIPIPPNGYPVRVSLDDGTTFRGGATLTAIQRNN